MFILTEEDSVNWNGFITFQNKVFYTIILLLCAHLFGYGSCDFYLLFSSFLYILIFIHLWLYFILCNLFILAEEDSVNWNGVITF